MPSSLDDWQQLAQQRALSQTLPYDGALLPSEAERIFLAHQAHIVDVRTQAERDFVGYVPGSYHVSWLLYPEGTRNRSFEKELCTLIPNQSVPLLFLCRSAHRSHYAAACAHALGYVAYNIWEGFEGDWCPQHQQRNRLNGWRHAGCIWIQT